MKKTVLDISNLKHNDIQHKELSEELIERIRAYKEILADVEPSSLEGHSEPKGRICPRFFI